MKLNKNLSGCKALAVVAHPDDETIWLGGFILRHPEMHWTIFSLCRASDPDRQPKFLRACGRLKAKPIITNLADDGRVKIKQLTPFIKKIIIKQLGLKPKFDYIFTHGRNGEYGHVIHRAVHRAVTSLIKEKKVTAKTFFCFNYRKSRQPTAKAQSDLVIYLTAREFKKKKAIMTEIYGFNPAGVDANYCTNPEAFKITPF